MASWSNNRAGQPAAAGNGKDGGSQTAAPDAASKADHPDNELPVFFENRTRRFITTLLLFGLIIEWLLPLNQLTAYTELYSIGPILVAVGGFLAVGLRMPPLWVSLLLNSAICIGSAAYIYSSHSPSMLDALFRLADAVQLDIMRLMEGQLMLGGESRTLLLIAGLGMMAVAIQSLVWMRQWGLGLTALTALYLLLLHSFLGIEVFAGLVRALAEGLLLNALLLIPRLDRLSGEEAAASTVRRFKAGWPIGWWSGAAWTTVVLLAIGAAASFGKPASDGPAPWALSAVDWAGNNLTGDTVTTILRERSLDALRSGDEKRGGAGWTGYGFDDSVLGGPIEPDDTPLFTVRSGEPIYLRGDSRDVYDGRGWLQEGRRIEERLIAALDANPEERAEQAEKLEPGTAAKSENAEESAGGMGQIKEGNAGDGQAREQKDGAAVRPEGRTLLHTVTALRPGSGWPILAAGADAAVTELFAEGSWNRLDRYRKDEMTDALFASKPDEVIKQYTIAANLPPTDPDLLRKAGQYEDPEAIAALYTQLPAALPVRVRELASRIADSAGKGRYDTAKGIEAYLRNGFTYTLSQTEEPPEGADFVDHFLFEQHQGYCVHFATSMVVLLRTQGIPARYVKGFAPGAVEHDADSGSGDAESSQPLAMLEGPGASLAALPPGFIGGEVRTAGKDAAEGAAGAWANAAGGALAAASTDGSAAKTYTVRASDAHAWVEVYFAGIGWVPFEPTPGFAAPGDAGAGSARGEGGAGSEGAAPRGPAAAGDGAAAGTARALGFAGRAAAQLQAAAVRAAEAAARDAHALARSASGAAAARPWAVAGLAAGAAAAALLAAAAWRSRERAAFAIALRRYGSALDAGRHAEARGQFLALADRLWRELHKRCGPRPPGRTAREYAAALQLPPQALEPIAEFVRWEEQARFGADWPERPSREQLSRLMEAVRRQDAKSAN
ncbi:DUF4129 domain-containing transglutaminase family protein [Paenibacillus spongiae]|uniref:DUF4129 domain-containing transglutaminase family protein n=1 Tax=Paenibacillus spongiae TaxID=2909671 RepID=A0ABY5SAF7_9BACL|nr:DUF4129 domain-containing transglutaminase family protein [Paenibacillus spongiae]UVI30909.1 DUF4129 domain-containing transglutaminase family protein [Paenibacillus spongiae]